MKKLNHWLRNYFGFSKTESNGFIILIPLIFIIIFSPFIFRLAIDHNPQIDQKDIIQLDSLEALLENRIELKEKEKKDSYVYEGSTKKPMPTDNNYASKEPKKKFKYTKKVRPSIQPFNINIADTAQLKKIYGIGPVLSERIVKYRDMLGGFNSKDQLKEVYGLKGDALKKLDSLSFIQPGFSPKQVDPNETKAYLLDDHPYISTKIAKAIDAYRFQHGRIDSIEVLYKIQIIDSAAVQRMAPYLKF